VLTEAFTAIAIQRSIQESEVKEGFDDVILPS
jgi:hypothetical protein